MSFASRFTTTALATLLVLWSTQQMAAAQSVLLDIYREQADVQAYNANAQQYQNDIINGNPLGAMLDIVRMNQASQQYNNDRQQLADDVAALQPSPPRPQQPNLVYIQQQPEQLVPHPTLPNRFYYPSNPGQLYFVPGNDPVASIPTPAPRNISTAVSPKNQKPVVRIKVRIYNPATNNVPISYAIDGRELTIESGDSTDLDVNEGSVITFNRGDSLGDARYRLSRGVYEFGYTDSGWEVYNKSFPASTTTAKTNSKPTNRINSWPTQDANVPPRPTPDDSQSN